MELNAGWILDADISGFFDNLDHDDLGDTLRLRVNDGGVLRFFGQWLNAGVIEGQELTHPEPRFIFERLGPWSACKARDGPERLAGFVAHQLA